MYRVCVDVGGTFTDCVVSDQKGNLREFKAPSTPDDFSRGVLDAMQEAAIAYGKSVRDFTSEVEVLLHGSTVNTNALLTRRLAKTALITSKGFRDVIEIRCSLKAETKSIFDFFIPPYEPVVPRYLRFGVDESVSPTGEIIKPVNESEIKDVISRLKKEKVEAVAICFINAHANAENERKTAQICRQEMEDVYIATSSDILPQLGEYGRASTCVISAALGPVTSKYLTTLEKRLADANFKGQLLVIQTNQFAQSPSAIIRKPVYLINSGPATAPAGASYLGKFLKKKEFITGDVGGTSFDMGIIHRGKVGMRLGRWLEDDWVGIEMVDVECIGAGGGSLAWVNPLGLLCVGPASAGAMPGPACYGKGGDKPTVTDAAVILGYIPHDYFLGGRITLNTELARRAIKTIADKINLSIEQTAQAIFCTINSNMVNGIMQISTKKGYDVRDFSLLAFGGGGALHAAFLAETMEIPRVIVPKFAASFCAWSMFALDIGRGYVRSYISSTDTAKPDVINRLYEEMINEAVEEFTPLKIPRNSIRISKSAEVRYNEQFYNIEVPLPEGTITSTEIVQMVDHFHKKHEEAFGFSMRFSPVEFRNLRILASVPHPKIKVKAIELGTEDCSAAFKRKRDCFFGTGYVETPIYDSARLKYKNVIPGPAVIEEVTTTVVIPKTFKCTVDKYGNYVLTRRV